MNCNSQIDTEVKLFLNFGAKPWKVTFKFVWVNRYTIKKKYNKYVIVEHECNIAIDEFKQPLPSVQI